MDKKGFTYLLTISLLLGVVIVVFLTINRYTYQDEFTSTRSRIIAMDDFVTNLDTDISRATYISSFRALLSLEDYVASSGVFFNDTESVFVEAFVNGTIDGNAVSLMNASTFQDYLNKVNSLANDLNLEANLLVNNVSLYHTSPWAVAVAINLNVTLFDDLHVASWNITKTYITEVPIYDLRDPLYSAFTNDRVINTIREYPVFPLVNSSNDTTYFIEFVNKSYYIASNYSPSFLQRFENNYSASDFGIESIVNVEDISAQDIGVYGDRVKVDYIYFNNLTSSAACDFVTVPSSLYVVLPTSRVLYYGLSGLTYSTSCP